MTGAYERLIAFEAAFNFRDLGGYPTTDGYEVRWRRVFRSAELNGMTPADVLLAQELGLRSVFDLRSPYELDERGIGTLFDGGLVLHRHTPFFRDVTAPATRDRDLDLDMVALYRHLLAVARPAISEIFVTLADEGTYPAVIHCAAGKDRTGLTAALLLTWLGVERATVLDDYELTGECWTLDDDRPTRDRLLATGMSAVAAASTLGAPRWVMAETLTVLDDTYGGVEAYLRGPAGMARSTLDALRDTLVR